MHGVEVSAKHIRTEPLEYEYSFGLVAAEDSGRPSDSQSFQSFPSFCVLRLLMIAMPQLAWLGHVTECGHHFYVGSRCSLELAPCKYLSAIIYICRYWLALASARSFLSGATTRSSLYVHVPTVCRTIGAIVVCYTIHSDSLQPQQWLPV